MPRNSYDIESFGQLIRQQYPELDALSMSDADLAREYFRQNPESEYLDLISNPDLLFPTSKQEPEGIEDHALNISQNIASSKGEPDALQEAGDDIAAWNMAKYRYALEGSEAAPSGITGFLKQVGFGIQQHITSMPSGLVGFLGWGLEGIGADETGQKLIDASEDLREWGRDYIKDVVSEDPELMALQIWQQDEPVTLDNFYQLDMLSRGLAQALPSLVEMGAMSFASGGLASLGYLAKGKKALDTARVLGKINTARKIGGAATGVTLEGSETWNTAMAWGEEQGLSSSEAAEIAGLATAIAAPIKGAMEYFSFAQLSKKMGIQEMSSRELTRILTGKVYKNRLARGGLEGLKNATQEAVTEWGQFMTDAFTQHGYKEGYGDTQDKILTNMFKVIEEEALSPEAIESAYSGFLMGKTVGFVSASVRLSPEAAARRLKEVDDKAKELIDKYKDSNDVKDLQKKVALERALRYSDILQRATKGMTEEQSQEYMDALKEHHTINAFDEFIEEVPAEPAKLEGTEKEVVNNYLLNLIDTKKELMDLPKSEDAPDELREFIDIASPIRELPKKEQLLHLIKKKPEYFNHIINMDTKSKYQIIGLAVKGLMDSEGLDFLNFDIRKASGQQLENILRIFIEKGNIRMTSAEATKMGEEVRSNIEMVDEEGDGLSVDDLINLVAGQPIASSEDIDSLSDAINTPKEVIVEAFNAAEEYTEDELEQAFLAYGSRGGGITLDEADVISETVGTPFEEEVSLPKTVSEMKQYIADNNIEDLLPTKGSGSNGNYIKKDYEYAIALHEESKDEIDPDSVEDTEVELTALESYEEYLTMSLEEIQENYNDLYSEELKTGKNTQEEVDKYAQREFDDKQKKLKKYKKDPVAFLEADLDEWYKYVEKQRKTDPDYQADKNIKQVKDALAIAKEQVKDDKPPPPPNIITNIDDIPISDLEESEDVDSESDKGKIVKHFTLKENISNILKKGFDSLLAPIFGVSAKEKVDKYKPEQKIGGKDVLYFTTDEARWNKAEVYVGEGKGTQDYTYYDYKKQEWVTEKNASDIVNLESIEAEIKEDSNVLVIDSAQKFYDFQEKHMDAVFMKDRLDDVIRKASELGYDVVNIKDTGQWVNSNGENIYDEATGLSGKDDYFILNKNAIDIQGLDVETEDDTKTLQPDSVKDIEVYHGSPDEFTEFDVEKSGQRESGGFGKGIAFTEKIVKAKEYATNFGRRVKGFVYKSKITLKNPLVLMGEGSYLSHFDKRLDEKVSPELKQKFDKQIEFLKELGVPVEMIERKFTDGRPSEFYAPPIYDIISNFGREKFTNLLYHKGYDGLILEQYRTKEGEVKEIEKEYLAFKTDAITSTEIITDEKDKITLQEEMTEEVAEVNKGTTAEKWTKKEQVKTRIATQYIGEGAPLSSTDRYKVMYEEKGLANTGEYSADDIVWISSNGRRKNRISPIIDGELSPDYKYVAMAMEAGATLVMDTEAHLKNTGHYNIGEVALAKWVEEHGYERKQGTGEWVPVQKDKITFEEAKKKLKPATDYQGKLAEGTTIPIGKSIPQDDKRTGDIESGFTGESPLSRLRQLYETIEGRKPAFLTYNDYANLDLFREIALANGLIEIKATEQEAMPFFASDEDIENWGGVPKTQVSVFVKPEEKARGERLAELHGEKYPQQQVSAHDTIQFSETDITEEEFHREVGTLLGYSKEEVDRYVSRFAPESTTKVTPNTSNEIYESTTSAVPVIRDGSNRVLTTIDNKKIQYNNDQQSGYDKILKWIDEAKNRFVLTGYAGTGKSTLISDVIKSLHDKKKRVQVAAPTHQAAKVLEDMGNEAITIHALMGFSPTKDLDKIGRDGRPFEAVNEDKLDADYVIVDEASMINPELLDYMLEKFEKRNVKVIFVLDGAQLPPVQHNSSPVTKIDGAVNHELTMVERQDGRNPLFDIFFELRDAIRNLTSGRGLPFSSLFENIPGSDGKKTKWFGKLDPETRDGILISPSITNIIRAATDLFKSDEYQLNKNYVRVLAGTNAGVKKWNDILRVKVYGEERAKEQLIEGEAIMPNESKDEAGIYNSVPFVVKKILREETRSFTLGDKKFEIEGYVVERETADLDDYDDDADYDSELFIVKGIDGNVNKAYIDASNAIWSKIMDRNIPAALRPWGKLRDFQRGFHSMFKFQSANGMNVKASLSYGFATTVHKAQGSTYTNTIIDVPTINDWGNAAEANLREDIRDRFNRGVTEWDRRLSWQQRDRMLYTAFTRPSSKLILYSNVVGENASKQEPLTLESKPEQIEYQDIGKMQSWESDLKAFQNITTRLQKHFPFIDVKAVERIVNEHGAEKAGRAMGTIVEWSKGKATLDTVPHEYAHIYINMFQESAIVKQGILKFGKGKTVEAIRSSGKETLAQYMGEYYTDRMTGSLRKRFGMWLKKFWLNLKRTFKPSKLTDSDIKELIASRFYSGYGFERASNYNDGKWEYHDGTDVNVLEDARKTSDSHIHSFYEKTLDVRVDKKHYRQMSSIAKDNDSYDDFLNEFKEFIRSNYPDATLTGDSNWQKDFNFYTRMFWQKQGNKIPVYDKKNSPSGRFNMELIITRGRRIFSGGEIEQMPDKLAFKLKGEEGGGKVLSTNNAVKEFEMMNFIEQDGIAERTVYFSLNDIVEKIDSKNNPGEFWYKQIGTYQFSSHELMRIESAFPNMAFVASKGGDHSALLFARVPDKYNNIDEEGYKQYWQRELNNNNITPFQYKEMVSDLKKKVKTTPNAFGQEIAKHEWWKSVKYPQYMKGTHLGNSKAEKSMGVQDHYDRLKMDFTDGFTARGMGTSSIMTVGQDAMVTDENGREIEPLSNYDGWMLSSGKWFKKLSGNIGKDVTYIKGALRSRTHNSDGVVDYIGTKSMQMIPYPGMQIKVDGEIVASYKGRGTRGHWVAADGKVFDHLSPIDTSKMTNGKYSRFNEVHELPEGYQKVLQLSSDKRTAAFPVTQGELAMDSILLNTTVGKNFADAIRKYYDSISSDYLKALEDFIRDPSALYKELKNSIDENDIMTELQKYVEIVGSDGKGLIHPAISPMWLDSIANKFIKGGLFKVRNKKKGFATGLYYKPYYAPAFQGKDLDDGDFAISSDNQTLVNHIVKEHRRITGRNVDYEHMTEHDKMQMLNDWLSETDENGKYKNNISVLLSRQPVAKISGVVLRNIRHLKEGFHGQTMMLSHKDVQEVFDGDWDGDKGAVQIIADESVLKAYRKFQNSKEFKKKQKSVYLDVWGKQLTETSLSDKKQVLAAVNSIASGMGKIGMITNGRNTMFSMKYKNFRIELDDGTIITPFKPTDEVILTYKEVNLKSIFDNHLWDKIQEQGDKLMYRTKEGGYREIKNFEHFEKMRGQQIAGEDIKVYLKTTKEHELAILLQMAVDDSKYGLLGQIGFDNGMLIGRMFKDKTGGHIYMPDHLKILARYKSKFNFSPLRQGFEYENDKVNKLDLEGLFEISQRLDQFTEPEYRKVLMEEISEDLQARYEYPPRAEVVDVYWNMKNLTPQERILMSLGAHVEKMSKNNPAAKAGLKAVPLTFQKSAEKIAHQMTTLQMNRNWVKKVGRYNKKDKEVAVAFAQKAADMYLPLFRKPDSDKESKLSIDYNQDIQDILDELIPLWNNMTNVQKMLSTLHYLMGTKTNFSEKNVSQYARLRTDKFLPLDIMHGDVVKGYLNAWYDNLMSEAVGMSQSELPSKATTEKEFAKFGFAFTETKVDINESLKGLCG